MAGNRSTIPFSRISRLCLFFIVIFNFQVSDSSLFSVPTVYERIYKEIDNIKACFRLLNATHQIGCSATPSNVSGVLWHIEHQENLTNLLDNHPHSPYIVILEPYLFTPENVRNMKKSGHVNGVVSYYNMSGAIPPELAVFSPGQGCPNSGFGVEDNCGGRKWNANGTSLTYDDFEDFAIFMITDIDSYREAIECFEKHNKNADGGYDDFPLCSAELQADMQAVISTAECYRRAQVWTSLAIPSCQPLGDNNVWGSLFELKENQDVIIVATKIDSSALIPDLAFGANNEVAGIVTQLAVAQALGDLKRDGSLKGLGKQILFVFFHGESFDYIGSSRMVYDMIQGTFPYGRNSHNQQPPLLNITNISSFLELSQVGIQQDGNDNSGTPVYYLHSNNNMSPLYKALKEVNESVQFSDSFVTQLPPASAQMFLRENNSIPVVILTDYDKHFNNKFFGSRYDTIDNLLGEDGVLSSSSNIVDHLTRLASSIAQVLLDISEPTYEGDQRPTPEADANTVSELLECFLVRTNCSLLRNVLNPAWVAVLGDEPASRYVTVNTLSNYETQYIFNLLAYFTGVQNNTYTTCKECDGAQSGSNQVYTYTTMSGSNYDSSTKNCTCFKSYTHRHEATSPAIAMEDYSSTCYSTWTESNWGGIGMRIYLVTFPLYEVAILFAGLLMLVVSCFVTWQCSRNARQIFGATSGHKIAQQS